MEAEALRPDQTWGVIWITGVPNVGKSSVADALSQAIRMEIGLTPVCLDGDLMRLLTGSTDVEIESGRRRLSSIYAQLCASIAKQGHLVIVSVVAMYREAFAELDRALPDKYTVIRLTASPADLLTRDHRGIYSARNIESTEQAPSEVPSNAKVLNTSGRSVKSVTEEVLRIAQDCSILSPSAFHESAIVDQVAELGRSRSRARSHWDSYYSTSQLTIVESSFAQFVVEEGYIIGEDRVVDFGCGNGRDTIFISGTASTIGIDSSPEAIARCQQMVRPPSFKESLSFVVTQLEDLTKVLLDFRPTVIYSRFVLHSLTLEEESKFLDHCAEVLPEGGRLLAECRTIYDPLASKGTRLSPTERVFGHYRRFIKPKDLEESLVQRGFKIKFSQTSSGIARLGQDDPVVTRLVAER